MTNYTELVKALRCMELRLSCNECEYGVWSESGEAWGCEFERKNDDAAAAIEALEAQLPKRVEIVRCGECIHFTQGGWCDREFDWFPVDENDFCSMAEKMEVQE